MDVRKSASLSHLSDLLRDDSVIDSPYTGRNANYGTDHSDTVDFRNHHGHSASLEGSYGSSKIQSGLRRRTHSFSHRVELSDLHSGMPEWEEHHFDDELDGSYSFRTLGSSLLEKQQNRATELELDDSNLHNVDGSLYIEFERALATEVEQILQNAVYAEGTERTAIMEDLFFNVASPIEPHVASRLRSSGGPINIPRYYYQLLAQYFATLGTEHPEAIDRLQSVMNSLLSHPHFPAIYCLLFHLWMLGTYEDVRCDDELAPSRLVVLTTGANRLFWADIQHNRFDFRPLMGFLTQVVLHPSRLSLLPKRLYVDLVSVVMRFFLYYDSHDTTAENLHVFFRQLSSRGVADHIIVGHVNTMSEVESLTEVDRSTAQSNGPQQNSEEPNVSSAAMESNQTNSHVTAPAILYNSHAASDQRHSGQNRDVNGSLSHSPILGNRNVSDELPATHETGSSIPSPTYNNLPQPAQPYIPLNANEMAAKVACFVQENAHQLRAIHHEGSLLRVLDGLKCLADPHICVFLDAHSAAKLQDELYAFTTPGGPLFPTRAVRTTARNTLDIVFPHGSGIRRVVSILFRLAHPYYWPGSFAHWCVAQTEATLARIPCAKHCFGRRQPAALINAVESSLDNGPYSSSVNHSNNIARPNRSNNSTAFSNNLLGLGENSNSDTRCPRLRRMMAFGFAAAVATFERLPYGQALIEHANHLLDEHNQQSNQTMSDELGPSNTQTNISSSLLNTEWILETSKSVASWIPGGKFIHTTLFEKSHTNQEEKDS